MGLFDIFRKKDVTVQQVTNLEQKKEENNNNMPHMDILDNNKDNEKIYFDTLNWFMNNKNSILNELKKLYIEWEGTDEGFCVYCIEAMDKQELISEEKFGDNQALYFTSVGDFIDKYDKNANFLKIQCGAFEKDEDAYSIAFINCDTKEIYYFFHRF